ASWFRYMSTLTGATDKPLDFKISATEAEVMPLPIPEITPPDTKTNLGLCLPLENLTLLVLFATLFSRRLFFFMFCFINYFYFWMGNDVWRELDFKYIFADHLDLRQTELLSV